MGIKEFGLSDKIKIIFLVIRDEAPSTRFRVLQHIPELETFDFDMTVEKIPKDFFSRLKLFNSLSSYDIVFLQKRLFQWWALWYIRRKSKILVYDFDDAVLFRNSDTQNFHSASRYRRFRNTMKYSDIVIAGNEYLRDLALPFTKNVFVIPTGINTRTYIPKPSPAHAPPFTIGWIGSKSNLILLKQLIEPINALHRTVGNFRLRIVCDDFIEGFECPVEKKIWTKQEEVEDIQSFDIGIMPSTDNKWTRGKCALKLLQYMSCGIASVSSFTDVTSHIIRDGVNGCLASADEQWVEKIRFLLENPDHLRGMGTQARKSLHGYYDSETVASQYAKLFHDAWSARPPRF